MPDDLKSKSCLIYDNGLFVELAPVLARSFGQVWYSMPWRNAYPKAASAHVGIGLAKNVERVSSFWDYVPDADVIVFPDVYDADMQVVCAEKYGKPVWGHRRAEMLELDRRGTRKLQKKLGVAAPQSRYFTGVDALEAYLKTVKSPRWVKISTYRGDGETWKHTSWHTTETYLTYFRQRVGALADWYEFLVEEEVEGVEIGFDGWTVRGDFPPSSFWGFEVKDKAYIGRFSPYDDIPEPVRDINALMSPILKEENATGFCSFEFRLGEDGTARMIDPCMRCGSPPMEGLLEAYANLSEIVWDGAWGRVAEPKAAGKYLAMVMLHSQFALTNWVPLDVPEDIRQWVKLRNAAELDGKLYHVPVGGEMPEIGAVVGVAGSLDRAIELVRERAEKVKGYFLEVPLDALDSACEEIEKAKDYGVEF